MDSATLHDKIKQTVKSGRPGRTKRENLTTKERKIRKAKELVAQKLMLSFRTRNPVAGASFKSHTGILRMKIILK